MYKQGRRFDHSKHEARFTEWKRKYNEKNDRRRELLLLKNGRRFKNFVTKNSSLVEDAYSYEIK